MTQLVMSSNLSVKLSRFIFVAIIFCVSPGCEDIVLNNPYTKPDNQLTVLYSSFSERPKHLDPAVAYSSNEYALIGQIYEPPLQYHYLKRPYTLVPLTATAMPVIHYLDKMQKPLPADAEVKKIAWSDYQITLQPGIYFQPHPAFAKNPAGGYMYHNLTEEQLSHIAKLGDFHATGTRELTARDYIYEIKRIADPRNHSPIAEIMKQHIAGLKQFSDQLEGKSINEIRQVTVSGIKLISRYQYRIRIKGKYPQFIYWLAMPFFSALPWEADVFYSQPGLKTNNISLDWYPVGTGPFMLEENNPNLRMVMVKNPNYHGEKYPFSGASGDTEQGLLMDAGKPLPFIDKVVYTLEKETIPYWNKFLQGYYDASGIASDSFDQAIQFTGSGSVELTPVLQEKHIQLQTAVTTSIFYMGFNMLDAVVGGYTEQARKLRRAISIAVDYEEYISIFMNGRGVPAQGLLPPGIYGYSKNKQGINTYVYDWINGHAQRKPLGIAKQLMIAAGYPAGVDPKTGNALILYLDTPASGPDDRARLNWYRKQFEKLGIQLVIRSTDYNRFQQKMRSGNAQIFMWGWNADYPDPENFFFLLYGPNAKVSHGGENAANFKHPEFDRLFEKMRNIDNGPERLRLIRKLQEIMRFEAPWIFGFHPKSFSLYQSWYHNAKPNLMANNTLKYIRIDTRQRTKMRRLWNHPVLWPIVLTAAAVLLLMLVPAFIAYRSRARATISG